MRIIERIKKLFKKKEQERGVTVVELKNDMRRSDIVCTAVYTLTKTADDENYIKLLRNTSLCVRTRPRNDFAKPRNPNYINQKGITPCRNRLNNMKKDRCYVEN